MENVVKLRPGRPIAFPLEERRRLILAAAEQVFVERGYGTSKMEEIAQTAEMSKKTLYQFFSDKEGVFTAMLQSEDMPIFPEIPPAGESASMLPVLRETLLTVARFILAPRHVALTRLVISEAHKSPELATSFYNNYIERFRLTLRDRLTELEQSGVPGAAAASRMVEPLIGAIIGPFHLKALMCCDRLSQNDLEDRVDLALQMIGLECKAGAAKR
ncbi:MAG: TetR/AcrR family transcriptional regulator [Allorhizobium sp.]